MVRQIKIPVVTRLQDNGDGGWTMYAYNSVDEMLADHPMAFGHKLTKAEREAILTEDDPYTNGYLGSDVIEIDVDDETHKARLTKHLHFHAGQ